MKDFWSSRIRNLTPYTPGEQPKERKFIKLNTNENPYPPSPEVLKAVTAAVDDRLKLYPDPDSSRLVAALAKRYRVRENQVFVGNGSDEVLAFAYQAFFEPGGTIVFPDITYSFYPVFADMNAVRYRTVPLREDFTLPVEQMLGDNDGVVVCNPNAPTGVELPQAELRRILEGNPEVVVIVDEAYIDFGGTSALPLLAEYPNLLVVQTMSKSRALAGMRVGFAFGSENLIQALNCTKNSINSYTMDQLAIVAGMAAVEDDAYFRRRCAQVAATRDKTAERLRERGFTVLPSRSNFLFITHRTVPAVKLFWALRERGILVRYFNLPRIDNYLRVTMGSEEDMETFCETITELVENVK